MSVSVGGLGDFYRKHWKKSEELILKWKSETFSSKTMLLVEGPSDCAFYGDFVCASVSVECNGGCQNIRSTFEEIRSKSTINCLAIKDSDFDRINNTLVDIEGFFYTDWHDHEMFFISEPEVLSLAMADLGIAWDSEHSLRTILEKLTVLSNLKWYNYTNKCSLKVKTIDLVSKHDDDFSSVMLFINEINDKTDGKCVFCLEDYKAFCTTHDHECDFNLANGHDLMKMIIRHGRCSSRKTISEKDLIKSLREHYSLSLFTKTSLYENVQLWAKQKGLYVFNVA